MMTMSFLANNFATTALRQTSCRKLEDCVKVPRGKNKKYTGNLKAEMLRQTLLCLELAELISFQGPDHPLLNSVHAFPILWALDEAYTEV